MRLAQVECEALSHRFPREKPKGIFRVSMFRVLFRVLEFLFFLGFVVDNKLFCALPLVLVTRVILLPQRREYGVVFATQRQIYIHIHIYNAGTCQHPPK